MGSFRVVFGSRDQFRVMDEEQNVFPAQVAGRLRSSGAEWPVVGDEVEGRAQPGDWILIDHVLERRNFLARRDSAGTGAQLLAANVDVLFIVTSANEDLNLNRLERYLVLARTGGVRPMLVINKIEFAEDPHAVLDEIAARFEGVDVHGISVHEGWNVDALAAELGPGRTAAFVGSSGVGKSSLINALSGREIAETQDIREDDSKGRHTTTHRELFATESGAFIIDTPGLRQVGLTGDADVDSTFGDVAALAGVCKFTDCGHGSEPGCAIKAALESGDLSRDRWESYLKLRKEVAYERRRSDKALQAETDKKWAKIHKDQRVNRKLKGR